MELDVSLFVEVKDKSLAIAINQRPALRDN